MKFFDLMPEMNEIAGKTKELLSRAGFKLADAIITRMNDGVEVGGKSTERDIRNAIKDFSPEEREEILIKALVGVAIKASSYSSDIPTPKKKKSTKSSPFGF